MSSLIAEHEQWNAFLQNDLPTRKDERWKYTDLSTLATKKFSMAKRISPDLFEDTIHQYRLQSDSILLIFLNGQFQPTLSDLNKLPNAVVASRLDIALQQHIALVKEYLPSQKDKKLYPFAHLNAAMCTEAFFLYVPSHCEITRPIHLLSLVTDDEQFAAHLRFIMILDQHSKATIIEEHHGVTKQAYFMNLVSNITVKKDAKLDHIKIQSEGQSAIHMANIFVDQKQNSQTNFVNISLGGEFARDDLVIELKESGAECHTAGFYHSRTNNQYIDNHIDIKHAAPRSNSDMLYKGILENKSRAVFNGRLYVEKGAQKILAYQANHNLLLSKEAEVYSKPELEIYADDVKCKHGASTGQIDQDAIFYLRSRGIGYEEALSMLLQGFADEIIERIPHAGIKTRVQELL